MLLGMGCTIRKQLGSKHSGGVWGELLGYCLYFSIDRLKQCDISSRNMWILDLERIPSSTVGMLVKILVPPLALAVF